MAQARYQQPLIPALTRVTGNADFTRQMNELTRIDELLVKSGVEDTFIRWKMEEVQGKNGKALSGEVAQQVTEYAIRALRCCVLKMLTLVSHRVMARLIAGMPLYQWFCRLDRVDGIKAPAKSTLQRYEQDVPEEVIRGLNELLVKGAAGKDARGTLRLKNRLDVDAFYADTTCVEANIHFPVDWVLMRDGVRTLVKSIQVIRKHGLRKRMPEPKGLMKEINRLCIAMTHTARRPDGKRCRKKILRQMKQVAKIVKEHGERYRDALEAGWRKTDLTENEAQQILSRIDGVVEQLPEAMRQAHERIIGERPVANADKILSLYEPDVRVIVRGKAGAEVEFGNTLMICEQRQGVVVDYQLYREQAPSDSKLTPGITERVERLFPDLHEREGMPALVADRGFHSQRNVTILSRSFFNGVASKAPDEYRDQQKDPRFVKEQTRRSQTEGRISIVKRQFIGDPARNKGFESRAKRVAWAILAHNLWVIARLEKVKSRRKAA